MNKILGELIEVEESNYFEKTGHYSNSFVKSWKQCPFHVVNKKEVFNKNFFIGHYVEDLICGGDGSSIMNREDYKDGVLKKDGEPYKWVLDSDVYAEKAMMDKNFMKYINDIDSKFQVILTGDIGGFKFKCAIDVLNMIGTSNGNKPFILDLKTTGNKINELVWIENEEGKNVKVPFIESWGYHTQLAIYRELVFQNYGIKCEMMIGVVTKKIPSDREIISLDGSFDPDYEIRKVIRDVEKINYEIDMGIVNRCETCETCISTKKIKGKVSYKDYFGRGIN
jgi:hypothetical protein